MSWHLSVNSYWLLEFGDRYVLLPDVMPGLTRHPVSVVTFPLFNDAHF
jgi:hypothetical protein